MRIAIFPVLYSVLKKYIRSFIFCTFWGLSTLWAGTLHELRTASLTGVGLAAFDVYQKYYYNGPAQNYWLREQNLLLAVSKSIELGIHLPMVNHHSNEINRSEFGDLKLHVNIATEWFEKYVLTNWYVEFNAGNGPKYTDPNFSPMESYGFPEIRTGVILMKKRAAFTLHFNLFYVFRSQKTATGSENNITNGLDLNIFSGEAWQRGLGFSPADDRNFLYKGNFPNDNLEYLLAVNTDLFYPLVPFWEFTLSHAFGASSESYIRPGPGSGIFRSQTILGTKWFPVDERFAVKAALAIPIAEMSKLYGLGFSLGVRLEF